MIGPDTVTKNPWSWFLTPWPGKIFTRIDSKVILWAQDTVTILTKKSYVYYSCSICTFFLEICFFPSKPQSLVIFLLIKQTIVLTLMRSSIDIQQICQLLRQKIPQQTKTIIMGVWNDHFHGLEFLLQGGSGVEINQWKKQGQREINYVNTNVQKKKVFSLY